MVNARIYASSLHLDLLNYSKCFVGEMAEVEPIELSEVTNGEKNGATASMSELLFIRSSSVPCHRVQAPHRVQC